MQTVKQGIHNPKERWWSFMRRKKPPSVLIIVPLTFVFLIAICVGIAWLDQSGRYTREECGLPPKGFSDADLIGTWRKTSLGDVDTLIIRGDGLYQQIIHLENPKRDYQSEWQPWRLGFSQSGVAYVHMQGLRICAFNRGYSCDWVNDGERPWTDYCQDDNIYPPPGEIVLTVLHFSKYATVTPEPGFGLTLFSGLEDSPWSYIYLGP
jgi:hypothetical protein